MGSPALDAAKFVVFTSHKYCIILVSEYHAYRRYQGESSLYIIISGVDKIILLLLYITVDTPWHKDYELIRPIIQHLEQYISMYCILYYIHTSCMCTCNILHSLLCWFRFHVSVLMYFNCPLCCFLRSSLTLRFMMPLNEITLQNVD
jgi:hypothetical protein